MASRGLPNDFLENWPRYSVNYKKLLANLQAFETLSPTSCKHKLPLRVNVPLCVYVPSVCISHLYISPPCVYPLYAYVSPCHVPLCVYPFTWIFFVYLAFRVFSCVWLCISYRVDTLSCGCSSIFLSQFPVYVYTSHQLVWPPIRIVLVRLLLKTLSSFG